MPVAPNLLSWQMLKEAKEKDALLELEKSRAQRLEEEKELLKVKGSEREKRIGQLEKELDEQYWDYRLKCRKVRLPLVSSTGTTGCPNLLGEAVQNRKYRGSNAVAAVAVCRTSNCECI